MNKRSKAEKRHIQLAQMARNLGELAIGAASPNGPESLDLTELQYIESLFHVELGHVRGWIQPTMATKEQRAALRDEDEDEDE